MFGNCISISDFSRQDLETIFEKARDFDSSKSSVDRYRNTIMGTLFYEPSTRTRLSFESAMNRLGGNVIGFADSDVSSAKKGETIADTVRTVENYTDLIVIRHPIEGAAKTAASHTEIPVINAGDGGHEHPTQTLLDLYTIKKETGKIDDTEIALCGDLKYGRTVHSLARALNNYNVDLKFVSPKELRFPEKLKPKIDNPYQEHGDLEKAMDSDVIYMTRIQKERFKDPKEYERVKSSMILSEDMARETNGIIMHPLPRVDEIEYPVDELNNSVYFSQAGNGVPVRMALIDLLLGGEEHE